METLYDLLGALPRDEADDLRTAFRRAVKGAHPDLRPDDPDAALKFRQIVRANEILGDPEQRAAYDYLLTLAQLEKTRALAHPIATKIHKLASTMMALASASIVAIGGYLIFMHMSMALVAPSAPTASAHKSEDNADLTSRVSASIAAVNRAAPSPAESESEPATMTMRLPDVASAYASLFHALQASAASDRVSSEDRAIQLDPKLIVSYAGQGFPFDPTPKSDHVFADTLSVKRTEKPSHAKSVVVAFPKTTEKAAPPRAVPLPRPRKPTHIFTEQRVFTEERAWYASASQ
jgi:curved DNA-binding protein CbpA